MEELFGAAAPTAAPNPTPPRFIALEVYLTNGSAWEAACDDDIMPHVLMKSEAVPLVVCTAAWDAARRWFQWNYTMVVVSHHDVIEAYMRDLTSALDDVFRLLSSHLNLTNVSHTQPTRLLPNCEFTTQYYDVHSRTCHPRTTCGDSEAWNVWHAANRNVSWQDEKCVFNTLVLLVGCVAVACVVCGVHCSQYLCCRFVRLRQGTGQGIKHT